MLAARRVPPPLWNLKLGNPLSLRLCDASRRSTSAPSSSKHKSIIMDIAEIASRQLAPSVGTTGALDPWFLSAPSSTIRRLWRDSIQLGSIVISAIFDIYIKIYIKLMEKTWKISSARLETRLHQQPSRAVYETGKTSALRTLPKATRNSSG